MRGTEICLWSFSTFEEIITCSVRTSQCRQSSLIECDVGFSWFVPLNAWLPLRTDWTTDPETESWSGAWAPEDYWAAGSRQQTFNPFGLSVGGEMLGTTTCNSSEVMYHVDRAVRPGVKFVLRKGTLNSPHTPAGVCISRCAANVAVSTSQVFMNQIASLFSSKFSLTLDFYICTQYGFSPLFMASLQNRSSFLPFNREASRDQKHQNYNVFFGKIWQKSRK